MPVEFNEPLSFLQRMTETFEYAGLLERAATKDDPVERMQARTHRLHTDLFVDPNGPDQRHRLDRLMITLSNGGQFYYGT